MSRICEAFGCVPSVAVRELRRHGDAIGHMLEYRAYADALQRFETGSATDAERQGDDPMMDLVWEFHAAVLKETRD